MAETIRRIRPTPTDEYLSNPHKGCCTFQHFNGDDLFPGKRWSEEGPTEFPPARKPVADGYLPTTVAYCRWFWRLMEPEQGQYDFSMIDRSLEVCEERGQTLAVRLMAHGSARQPQVPDWYAASAPMQSNRSKSIEFLAPDYNAPEYLEHWGGFVREFARRYDGHPRLESIDITYIGPWGEGAGECSPEQCRRFAELWAEAFPNTPRLALIAGEQMRQAVLTGSGWRCDCFGDLRRRGSATCPKPGSYNHHFDSYPKGVCLSGAQDAWKNGPVHFETCGVPATWLEDWEQDDADLEFIFQQGRKFHGTYFMPKSTALPDRWKDRIAGFCRSLGYRFVLRQAILPVDVSAGGKAHVEFWIENIGVAPLYHPYHFAVRFRQGDRSAVIPLPQYDVKTWLPGDVWIVEDLPLPEGFQPGWVEVSAGLVAPGTEEAKVSFAIKERFADRWAFLEGFSIV